MLVCEKVPARKSERASVAARCNFLTHRPNAINAPAMILQSNNFGGSMVEKEGPSFFVTRRKLDREVRCLLSLGWPMPARFSPRPPRRARQPPLATSRTMTFSSLRAEDLSFDFALRRKARTGHF